MSNEVKTLTIDDEFYTERDAEWIFGLILEYFENTDIRPSSLRFSIEVEYTEDDL